MIGPMNYVEPPDVPEGMTLREYRAACARHPVGAIPRAGALRRLLRRGAREPSEVVRQPLGGEAVDGKPAR